MRLIYFYLIKCCGIDFSLEVNLSEDKYLKVTDSHELKISDTECIVHSHFYGDNIINVSAIVGRNGVGKSSILNLLGLNRLDLYSCYPDSQWLAIYESEGIYFLEGFNVNEIINIERNQSSYISYKLNRIGDSLHLDSFIQNFGDIQDKYCVIHKPDFANNINSIGNGSIHNNDDRNYGFKRNYLHTNMANFYEFVTVNMEGFCSHLNKKNISFKTQESLNETNKKKFKFYDSFDRYLDTNISTFRKNQTNKIKDFRKLFVINLLEEYILYIINNVFNVNSSDVCQEIIDSNIYEGDLLSYDNIKGFLLNILKAILDALTRNDDEILSYLGDISLDIVMDFFENEEKLTFLKEKNGSNNNITCCISLEEYSEKVHSFISKFEVKNIPIIFKKPKMSSGEFDINSKIAGINKAIKLTIDNNPEIHGFIIILDEYDEHLHPEWSRSFLDYLLRYLCKRYANYSFQVILSTHSPYVISDLLKENVIKIEYDYSNGNYVSSKADRSFASNIYDIINDSFFLSQPIGEFAVRKINEIVSEISKINMNVSAKYYTNMCNLINVIDDDYIRKTLLTQLNSNYDLDNNYELERLDEEIKYLNEKKEKIINEMREKL